jgi:REP element-mobilizing transposase RayT
MTQEIGFERFIPCHVLSRAIDKKIIFSDQEDCARFIFQMYAVNIGKPGYNLFRRNMIEIADLLLDGKEIEQNLITSKDAPLVDVLSFSLTKDHVHFILTSNIENGIPKYMHKLNLSYAKYFNSRHKREGVLFNKPYKITPLKTGLELDKIMRYINVKNPLDIYNPEWQKGLDNWKEAFDFLANYKFSSYPDLFGKRESKVLASRVMVDKYLGAKTLRKKIENIDFIEDYLADKMKDYKVLFLEK